MGKDLVETVAQRLKVQAADVRLVFSQQILKENKTLAENKIIEGATVQVTLRKAPQAVEVKDTNLPDVKVQP